MTSSEPLPNELAIVIITRNEAAHIAMCIESVLRATAAFPTKPDVVVVDSDSSDATTTIAVRYPVRVFRYQAAPTSAAAGRWIGTRLTNAPFVFFLDGDCQLSEGWLEVALAKLSADSTLGVICGTRYNIVNGVTDTANATAALGGSALYRRVALERSGGFNPFIIGGEEHELRVRLEAHGYRALSTRELMSLHHTMKKETPRGMWRRYRTGMQGGPGQVLRVALRDGLFLQQARYFDRYVGTAAYLLIGILTFLLAISVSALPAILWALVGVGAALMLVWRRRSAREAVFIVLDWVSVAIASIRSFARHPHRPDDFAYNLEEVRPFVSSSTSARETDLPVVVEPTACH